MSGASVRGLEKAFGPHDVLRSLDLDVPSGSFTAILGVSGSGKTTLLRVLAGFERPDRGTIAVGERLMDGPGVHVRAEERRIGYVPQEGSLFPHLSVASNVGFGLPRRERRRRAEELLELVGLAGMGRRYPHELSGGQQQRVALARALAVRPEMVLLDEPFASLDVHLRSSVRGDVLRILRQHGATAVLVTHDQDEALSLADRVAVLREGVIVQDAAPRELYERPVDPQVASFVGEANVVSGTLEGPMVATVLGVLPLAEELPGLRPGTAVDVLVRPEQIDVWMLDGRRGEGAEPPASEGVGESSSTAGRVTGSGYHGHDVVLRVEPALEQSPALTVRTLGQEVLARGSRVGLAVRGEVRAWPAAREHTPAPAPEENPSA